MSLRTVTISATNGSGTTTASADVTIADPPGSGNVVELVGNPMSSVDPNPARNAVYAGYMGQGGVLADSGMTYCPWYGPFGAVVVAGGGHADYGGNEVYVYEFTDAQGSAVVKRINNPSTAMNPVLPSKPGMPTGSDLIHGELSDGSPVASHTYSCLTAIPGGNKGRLLLFSENHMSWNADTNSSGFSHACDLESGIWSRFSTNAAPHRGDMMCADNVCYDATRNRVWGHVRSGPISYLDLATGVHSGSLGTAINGGYIPTSARVPVNDLMLCLSSYWSRGPWVFSAINLANPATGQKALTLTGDIIPPALSGAGGFDWDTSRNRGYIYIGNWTADAGGADNSHVWQVDPPASGSWLTGTWTLTKVTLPSPFPAQLNGVYSRWRYCSGIGKFALVSKTANKLSLWTPPA